MLPFQLALELPRGKQRLLPLYDTENFNLIQVLSHFDEYGTPKRRQRRRPSEMVRIYKCNFDACTKAYSSISHLNTHIKNKTHGLPKKKTDFVNSNAK